MDQSQKYFILALLISSAAAWVIPAVIFSVRYVFFKSSLEKKNGVSRMLAVSGYLIFSVWCLRYAVGYFTVLQADATTMTLTWGEEVFNSLIHALQTFSMDEDYTTYIIDGKMMLRELLGEDNMWETTYGLYASALNFIAPIAGGAIIFEILASVFPWIKLRVSHFAVWKEKYYFSELNQSSLALATSICKAYRWPFRRPVIVFSDVYADFDNEGSTEIIASAKELGAICVRDDLAHVRKNWFGGRKYFLIDDNESENLRTLVQLAEMPNTRFLKRSEIYLFTNEDAYVQVEKQIKELLETEMGFSNDDMPIFVPVQSDRNMITNLLVDVPLYEPLISKQKDTHGQRQLTVSILGSGCVGMEMFLAVYWFGQILDCKLNINVISQETEETFWSKLDYRNPEIKHTTKEGNPILRKNRKGEMADPYCHVEYIQCDVKSSNFVAALTDPEKKLLDTDYFLVSLGADADSISVANTIRRYVGDHHIKTKRAMKTVIAYVVYDSSLSDMLNRQKFFSFVGQQPEVYMQAVGSIRDVYSVRNVFLDEYEADAQMVDAAYDKVSNRQKRAKAHTARMKDEYKHWSSRAQAMHRYYRIFSMGLMDRSIFDYPNDAEAYQNKRLEFRENYRQLISGEIEFENDEKAQEHLTLLHRMAWMEHRRWNAFTRVKGFRSTANYDVYAVEGKHGSYKQMDLKLHPCLVECDEKGIRATVSVKGVIDESSLLKQKDSDDLDLLDELTYDLYEKNYNGYDFKQFDYPIYSI